MAFLVLDEPAPPPAPTASAHKALKRSVSLMVVAYGWQIRSTLQNIQYVLTTNQWTEVPCRIFNMIWLQINTHFLFIKQLASYFQKCNLTVNWSDVMKEILYLNVPFIHPPPEVFCKNIYTKSEIYRASSCNEQPVSTSFLCLHDSVNEKLFTSSQLEQTELQTGWTGSWVLTSVRFLGFKEIPTNKSQSRRITQPLIHPC